MEIDSYDTPDAERLLQASDQRDQRPLDERRERLTHAVGATGFVAAAVLLAALAPWERHLSVGRVLIVLAAYLVAERVSFPVGGGWTCPVMVVFVPVLFILPTPTVPLFVMVATVLRFVPDFIRGRARISWLPRLIGDAWFSIGPVLVIVLAGAGRFAWAHWPVYLGALLAQLAFDLAATVGRYSVAEGIEPRVQLPRLVWIYAVDASLAPLGLLVAASATRWPGLVLLALPLIALLGLFARERGERMESTLALSTAYRGTALLLGDVIEDDDEYTGLHSRAVVDLAVAVAERLGLDATQRRNVEFGALLHDVGKIRIPKEIIHKSGQLDDAEWAIMREHTVYGEQMLRQVGGTLSSVGKVVRHSHERFDGTGYPDGLAGQAIPIEARIVCACDAFNAMTTHRPYRGPRSLAAAVEEMQRCSGTHFDPQVVYALLTEVAEHPPPLVVARPAATPVPETASTAVGVR